MEEIVYLIKGEVDINEIQNICDGACQKEFGKNALQWQLTSVNPVKNKGLAKKLTDLQSKKRGLKYLVIQPQEA